jgi:hypothetical protein
VHRGRELGIGRRERQLGHLDDVELLLEVGPRGRDRLGGPADDDAPGRARHVEDRVHALLPQPLRFLFERTLRVVGAGQTTHAGRRRRALRHADGRRIVQGPVSVELVDQRQRPLDVREEARVPSVEKREDDGTSALQRAHVRRGRDASAPPNQVRRHEREALRVQEAGARRESRPSLVGEHAAEALDGVAHVP